MPPHQLFGWWAIEESRFRRMVDLARTADLASLRVESRAASQANQSEPLYALTPDGIALIAITGSMTKYPTSFQALLGGTATLRTREALRAAVRDPDAIGIMLVVDSPGGTIAGTADLADDVRRAALRKPLYAHAEDLTASAALWAISGARKVYANASAEIVSIGAYAVVEDTSQVYAQEGVKVHVISSAPPFIGAGVEGTEISPAQLAEWERQVKDLADIFVTEFARGRRLEKAQAQALATGQMWVADKARELGLIDGVVSLDEAMRLLRREAMEEKDAQAALALAEEAQGKADAEKAARLAAEKEAAELRAQLAALQAKERRERFSKEAVSLDAPVEFAPVLDKIEAAVGAEVYAKLTTQLQAFRTHIDKPQSPTHPSSSTGTTDNFANRGRGFRLLWRAQSQVIENSGNGYLVMEVRNDLELATAPVAGEGIGMEDLRDRAPRWRRPAPL